MSIPKQLHYCWVGPSAKPDSLTARVKRWQEMLPDYTLREWGNDDLFGQSCKYALEAYDAGKYAFASDFLRVHALAEHGGVYLDTDVDLLGSLDPFLEHGAVFGFEEGDYVATSLMMATPQHPVIAEMLEGYYRRPFIQPDGAPDLTTNVQVLTRLLEGYGLKRDGARQTLAAQGAEVSIFPRECFSPYDYINHQMHRDESTVAIHHFGQSWLSPVGRLRRFVRLSLIRAVGPRRARLILDRVRRSPAEGSKDARIESNRSRSDET